MDIGEVKIESRKESLTVLWKIPNFTSISATTGVSLKSPTFETTGPHSKRSQWKLILHPNGLDKTNQEYISLRLCYLNSCQVTVSYSMSIVNDANAVVIKWYPPSRGIFKKNSITVNNKIVITNAARRALTNDGALLISCTITVHDTPFDDERQDEQCRATAHFQNLLETGDFSDVTFEIENKQMKLHKAIVSSGSPVFLAMFQHLMKENEENVVKIPDVKYEVMEQLFRYIYTRRVRAIGDMAMDLIVAADKYDVKVLKLVCEDVVSQSLDVDNALELLVFAVTYNTTFLKSTVIEFILSRLREIVNRPEFEQIDRVYKDELLRAMAKKIPNE